MIGGVPMTPQSVALLALLGVVFTAVLGWLGVIIAARTTAGSALLAKLIDGQVSANAEQIKAQSQFADRLAVRIREIEARLDTKLVELWRCQEEKLALEQGNQQQQQVMQRQIDDLQRQLDDRTEDYEARLATESRLREQVEADFGALRDRFNRCPHAGAG